MLMTQPLLKSKIICQLNETHLEKSNNNQLPEDFLVEQQ